ncbi:doublecortin domain-containing protein 2 isoform X10 [Mobula birostris]|uniref:doublecortin domain-containing protein 2 isoform X10 n=1 Tax=Mobula birostris TaxID=1983395 RepID=UPI003B28AF2F
MATASRGAPPQPPAAKSVMVYRNGDPFFTGRRFLINKQVSTFDTFLNQVTKGINAPFGAVRNIYTPKEGHRVFDLDELENGGSYVAAGVEKFKTLDYLQITTKKPQKKINEMIRPVVHSRIIVSARWKKYNYEPYTIKLCTLDGRPLLGAAELENNQYYVAVGSEKFKKLPYYQVLSKKVTVRETQGFHSDLLPPIRRGQKTRGKFELHDISHGESSDSGFLSSPQQSEGDSSHSTTDGQVLVGAPQMVQGQSKYLEAKPSREKNSIFRAKPMKVKHHKHSAGPLAKYEDNGVFKAQDPRKETQDAAEVREDADMRVDLPIDQMLPNLVPAEIVHEEEIPPYDNDTSANIHKDEDLLHGMEDYGMIKEQWNDPNGWTGDEDGLVENIQEYSKSKEDGLPNNTDHNTRVLETSDALPSSTDGLYCEQEDAGNEVYHATHDDEIAGVASEQSTQKDPVSLKSERWHEPAEKQEHVDEVSELEKVSRGQEKFRKLFGFHLRRSAKFKDGYENNK